MPIRRHVSIGQTNKSGGQRDKKMSIKQSMTDEAHHLHSSLREKIVEHVFVGEALRALWRRGVYDVEVMRDEFDAHGYDLVMARGTIVRHIQFKTGVQAKPGRLSIATALTNKPSGCVIWIQVNNALELLSFWWLGGLPGEPLPALGNKPARRIGRDAQGTRPVREAYRVVNGSAFTGFATIDQVLEELFGQLPERRFPATENEEGKGQSRSLSARDL